MLAYMFYSDPPRHQFSIGNVHKLMVTHKFWPQFQLIVLWCPCLCGIRLHLNQTNICSTIAWNMQETHQLLVIHVERLVLCEPLIQQIIEEESSIHVNRRSATFLCTYTSIWINESFFGWLLNMLERALNSQTRDQVAPCLLLHLLIDPIDLIFFSPCFFFQMYFVWHVAVRW